MDNHTPHSAAHGATYAALTFSFLAGGLAGATVALLLAPQSGKVTRQIMRRKLDDTADTARELKGRVADKLSDAVHSVRDLKRRAIRRGQGLREEAAYRVEGAAAALAGTDGEPAGGNGSREDDDSPA